MPNNSSSSSLFGRLSTSTRSSFMSSKDVRCNVHLLNDADIIANEFPRNQPAQTVLDYVCNMKNIQEKDFLGLRYQDHNKHRYWLDLSRSIGHVVKQFRTENLTLHLRFRYYPSDPTRIRDLNLRYQLFVQLQRDLLHGRLYCPHSQSAELAALILQAQIGDYNEEIHPINYVSGYKLLLKQTPKLEERIAVLHKEMKGKTCGEAELEFLDKASQLDTYAFDPYTIKDQQDPSNAVYLGASAKGILIYTGTSKTHHIDWSELTKVDYSGKELRIIVNESYHPVGYLSHAGTLSSTTNGTAIAETSGEKHATKKGAQTLKYICPSGQFAKHLWIHILSQQAFFNEASAQEVKPKFSKPRIPLLSRGSTFRFPSRRVYREIEESQSADENKRMAQSMNERNGNLSHDQTTDNESGLNISTISVPVVRYELQRQELRTQPLWLNKPQLLSYAQTSVNHSNETDSSCQTDNEKQNNNNKINSTNLNVSLAGTSGLPDRPTLDLSPSTSEEAITPVQFTHTVEKSDTNSTSFTVHLVRREASRSQSPATQTFSEVESRAETLEHEFNSIVEHDMLPGEPLASSTPRAVKTAFEMNGNGNVLTNGDVKTNGHAINYEQQSEQSVLESKGFFRKLTDLSFVFFLMFILTLAVVICVFEKSEGTTNDWIEKNKVLSELRHVYYEPARHYVVDHYRKYFGAKQ